MTYQVKHEFKWAKAEGLKIDKNGNIGAMKLHDITLIAKQTERKEKEKITIDNITFNPIEWTNKGNKGINVIISQTNSSIVKEIIS